MCRNSRNAFGMWFVVFYTLSAYLEVSVAAPSAVEAPTRRSLLYIPEHMVDNGLMNAASIESTASDLGQVFRGTPLRLGDIPSMDSVGPVIQSLVKSGDELAKQLIGQTSVDGGHQTATEAVDVRPAVTGGQLTITDDRRQITEGQPAISEPQSSSPLNNLNGIAGSPTSWMDALTQLLELQQLFEDLGRGVNGAFGRFRDGSSQTETTTSTGNIAFKPHGRRGRAGDHEGQ